MKLRRWRRQAAPGGACQVGNQGPQTVAQTLTEEEDAERASCVGNSVPHGAVSAPDVVISTSHDVGNEVPRRGRRRKSSLNNIQTGVAPSDSGSRARAPLTRPVEECYHIFDGVTGRPVKAAGIHLEPLPEVSELLNLEEMAVDDFLADLKAGEIAEVMLLKLETTPEELNSSSVLDEDVLEEMKKRREARMGSEVLKNPNDSVYPLVKEFADAVPKDPPSQLPPERGVRHEIDLVPGTKYCVTRQWPLPQEQCEVIDAFFAAKAKAGMVRESKSPHSTPTFCVRKPNGKWRLVHAYNKLNNATASAQTPIPRKDVLLNNMASCELYSALDLVDGYYQILMRESDIPLTVVSTPSGMLWEWLVMPQGLSNAPATFNRLVTQLFRPLRAYAQTYFDDIFVHSRAEDGKTAMEVHLGHLRRVLEVMRANKLDANIDKCVFASPEIKVLGCFVSNVGVRADPEKVKAVAAWPTPRSQKDLRKWLGLANYLHKYSAGYAGLARPLSELIKKNSDWHWERQHQDAFDSIKASLQQAPVLALPDETKPFSVVCDASDYAIGCALLQNDADGHERVISFQSRQLKAAERNYPVHDKELLAMQHALVKFRLHLLGSRPFVIYTDHASLRTATNSPHLSQRMARWLSFFAEYNFRVEYKPGKLNVLADALFRRPDYELAHITRVTTDLYDRIRMAYRNDESLASLVRFLTAGKEAKSEWLSPRQRSRLHRYEWQDGLLYYRVEPHEPPRVVVPNDEDLKFDILQEAHDAPSSGHLGREKTFLFVSQAFWWTHMYKWVAQYVKTCETCQRVKPAGHASAPLQSLPVPADCWKSMSLDFVFGLPADDHGNTGILVFVCRLSKMVHLAPVPDTVTGEQAARLFVDGVFRHHGLPETFVSDHDPRFTTAFWQTLFQLLGTRLHMSTADHPQTDGQTERVNRVLEDTLRSVCAAAPRTWSERLPVVQFALNNAVHASTGFTPFYLNGMRHPRVPLTLRGGTEPSILSGGEARKAFPPRSRT
ncbi:Transposon Tf2-9 polyprotein [Phytophthora idaei]|nr:Transposon Tf2-9 polyprotein [Phytophthora idaei]